MPPEPVVGITNPNIPGLEIQFVTLAAFEEVWEARGWEIAEIGLQPDVVYSIPSSEKGAPFGVATLDEFGNVVQLATGPTGGISEAEAEAMIAAAIAEITPASIGAIPESMDVILYDQGVQNTPTRGTHPAANGDRQDYVLTDGTCWVMTPTGVKVQIAPGFVSPTVELATEKTVNSITLSTVLSAVLEQESVYHLDIRFTYESTVAASGERLRLAFDPPPGTTGWWGVHSMNSTGAASGTLAPSWVAKQWDETFDIGGSGAALPRMCHIVGTVFTDDSFTPAPNAEANFDFRARLSTLEGAGVALVPAKIYGANTVDYDAAVMRLTKIGP